jgi:CRISPR type III-B/RAMP module-associated protein Cmr5
MAITLEQKRAAYAFKRAEIAAKLSGKTPQKYKRLAKGLPQMIMVSGLMPVLAFLHDKAETHHLQIYDDLSMWLASSGRVERSIPLATMMTELTGATSLRYQELTTESLAVLKLIRQLASAVIKGDD